ncbi:MAG: hypothetical protein U5M51_04145 [Emticicia sp.]|nr:hypothetical protein [Emticicia sp.]
MNASFVGEKPGVCGGAARAVDNGEPLGSPTMSITPALPLWLIAMDIDMIWNKPRCPQQNGLVEKMQGTSSRWAEIEKIANLAELQTTLDKEAIIQREKFPVKRLQRKTRLESFPELETSRRVYDTNDFDPNKVYTFLAKKTYTRKVSTVGTISHYGQIVSVGTKYKAQYVQLKFEPTTKSWLIFDNESQIKSVPANHLSKENILNLTVCQRTATNFMSD